MKRQGSDPRESWVYLLACELAQAKQQGDKVRELEARLRAFQRLHGMTVGGDTELSRWAVLEAFGGKEMTLSELGESFGVIPGEWGQLGDALRDLVNTGRVERMFHGTWRPAGPEYRLTWLEARLPERDKRIEHLHSALSKCVNALRVTLETGEASGDALSVMAVGVEALLAGGKAEDEVARGG